MRSVYCAVVVAHLAVVACLGGSVPPAVAFLERYVALVEEELPSIRDQGQRRSVLCALARIYFERGELDKYWKVATEASLNCGSAMGYHPAVHHHTSRGEWSDALRLSSRPEASGQRDVIKIWIIKDMLDAHRLEESKALYRSIGSSALKPIARDAIRVEEVIRGEASVAQLLTDTDLDRQGRIMCSLIERQIRAGQQKDAEHTLSRIASPWWRIQGILRIADRYWRHDDVKSANDRLESALRLADELPDDHTITSALYAIAASAARAGCTELTLRAFERAVQWERRLGPPALPRPFILHKIETLTSLGRFAEAAELAIAEDTGDGLLIIGQSMGKRDKWDELNELAESVEEPVFRACLYVGAAEAALEVA